MHDNRWTSDKEEEKGQKEEHETGKENPPKETTEVIHFSILHLFCIFLVWVFTCSLIYSVVIIMGLHQQVKAEVEKAVPEVTPEAGTAEEDEDEWEDASDGDEEDDVEDAPATPPRQPATSSPKEKRTPAVYIPPPQDVQASPEGGKPLSPFSPLEGHQPVSDWGEEMEMLSPRTSMEESPLRPSSSSETNTSQENKGQDSPAHTGTC